MDLPSAISTFIICWCLHFKEFVKLWELFEKFIKKNSYIKLPKAIFLQNYFKLRLKKRKKKKLKCNSSKFDKYITWQEFY